MWIPLQYANCVTWARVTELTVTELTNRLVFSKNRHTQNKISMMFATKKGLSHPQRTHYIESFIYIFLNIYVTVLTSMVRKSSVFIPIFKKGDAKECENYRTIAMIF